MNIISASRRTDIPAFYMDWFMNRLEAGFARYLNPFGGTIHTVSLRPEDVHSIVLWSKHYGPFLAYLDAILERGYGCCFHYTITAVPANVEPHVPDWQTGVRILRELARRTSSSHVLWRFDPILLTHEWGPEYYLRRFREMTRALAGSTRRCYFSFVALYGKVSKRLARTNVGYREADGEERRTLAEAMADMAQEAGMTLHACCQDDLVSPEIREARCIDGELLAELYPDRPVISEVRPTRKGCGCTASRDIGMYDTCTLGCLYCYANQGREVALRRWRAHDPHGEMLVG
jgi:hypothetical protein